MTRYAGVAVLTACVAMPSVAADSPAAQLATRGRWKELRGVVDARLKANPNDAEALWLLSQVKMAWRDPDGALAPAERAAALDPKNVEYRFQVAQVVGEQAERAGIFSQMGLARRFKREDEAALALDPRHIPSLMGMMIFCYQAPGIVGGDKKRAADIVLQIMAINKVDGYLAQARLAQEAKHPEEVEPAYVKAAEADPNRYDPRITLASVYSNPAKPRWDLAEREALAALKLDPDRGAPYQILAAVYATAERWADLDALLAEEEKHVPGNLSPHLRAAGALLLTGKELRRAEGYTRRYLGTEPEPNLGSWALAHWRLGLILEKEGRKGEAVTEVETAVRLDPKFAPAQKDLKRMRG